MTDANSEYLRKQLLQAKKKLGELGGRIEKSEKQMREIAKDRDHWRSRAERAEAELKSR